jgi:hypothetical protein
VTSPLAIEAALEGLAHRSMLAIEEADEATWLEGPAGRHVVDVALPLARSPHAYSHLGPTGAVTRPGSLDSGEARR